MIESMIHEEGDSPLNEMISQGEATHLKAVMHKRRSHKVVASGLNAWLALYCRCHLLLRGGEYLERPPLRL